MKINIKATRLDLTPSIERYIEDKLGALAKFVKKFDETGQPELWVEIARTTRHHRHGAYVFMAEADIRLPGKILRGAEYGEDVRAAIDKLRTVLRLEIEKYKTRHSAKARLKRV
jgi:ribosomal subunit interface protein